VAEVRLNLVHDLLATHATHLQRRRTVDLHPLDVMDIKTNYCDATMAMLLRTAQKIVVTF
jgi:hypothetical protein